jgi:hypothetical protein
MFMGFPGRFWMAEWAAQYQPTPPVQGGENAACSVDFGAAARLRQAVILVG